MNGMTFSVPLSWDGRPAGSFLRYGCGISCRTTAKLRGVPGGITADGVWVRTVDPVYAGQAVRLSLPRDEPRIPGAAIPLRVVFEDAYLLVIDKPPFLAVHPSAGRTEPTLANMAVHHYAAQGRPAVFRPLSRLDRNTSGLLLAAKNAPIAHTLTGRTEKTYLAVVLGRMTGSGTVDRPIRVRTGSCITREVGDGGKPSITHWRAVAANEQATLLELTLETGRTHQIRVHMAWLGHPLAGDTMYGSDRAVMPRQGLHCADLRVTHPVTGEAMRFRSPPPPDMAAVIAGMRPV